MFKNPPDSAKDIRLVSTQISLETWQSTSNMEYLDGSKLYTGSVTSDKINAGAVDTVNINSYAVTSDKIATSAVIAEKIDSYAVTKDKIATGALAAYQITQYGKYASLPDTATTITHNLGYVPSLVMVWPGYDSGVFGYVAFKDVTATTFTAQASVSGVDLHYAIFA